MATRWIVQCRVSGGVTGTREAVLKANGATIYFETEAEAKARAADLMRKMNHAHSVADFRYWAEVAQ